MPESNKHIPVLLNELKKFIPKTKKINVIDATFGGGGYSKEILNASKRSLSAKSVELAFSILASAEDALASAAATLD